jgi:hypothetical protein
MGTEALAKASVDGAPLVQAPSTWAEPVGAAVIVQFARPLVLPTTPPVGMVMVPVLGEPFCMDTAQLPLVVMVALTPGMPVLHELKVGALMGEETGPASLWLPGAAGIRFWSSVPGGEVGTEEETVHLAVTEPDLKLAVPVSFAVK